MLAASPTRIMRQPPAAFHNSGAGAFGATMGAGAFGARPIVLDSIILAGEAASTTTPKKEYQYLILTPFWKF